MNPQIPSGRPSWRRAFFLAALLAFCSWKSPCAGAANLIVNGDFETGDFTGWTLNFTPPNDAAVIVTQPPVVYQGSHAVDFSYRDVPATAVLAQTLNTAAAAVYDVRFAFGTMAWDDRSPTLLCEVLGADRTSVLAARTLSRRGLNPAGGPAVFPAEWSMERLSFTADGSSATLRFTDLTTPSLASDALLDLVSVEEPGCPDASIRVSEVEICWASRSNALYQVDYRSELTTNLWVPLYTNILGSGSEMCVSDRVVQPRRFYQVVCATKPSQ